MRTMSIFKPSKHFKSKREILEDVLKDLAPGIREEARRIILEENLLDKDIDYIRRRLKEKGLLK